MMTENETNETQIKPQTKYKQQILHKGSFENRPRSSSFSSCISREEYNKLESSINISQPSPKLDTSNNLAGQENIPKTNADPNSAWQQDRVPQKKRKRLGSPTENASKQPMTKRLNYSVPVQNQFEILSDDEHTTYNKTKEYVPKPEPIFVTGIVNITPLRDLLNKVVDTNKYTMTTLRAGHIIKLMPTDVDTYKTMRDNLMENNINHYTYKLKSERAYRVVIRGFHASEDITIIKDALQAHGHEVRQIVNVLHRTTKEKLPLYFVDLEPQANNKDIFKLKHISHVKVTIEAPYKKKEVLQCKRCQRFGHSKNQCFRPFRCVKCGNDHPTATCNKSPETEATCANCQGKHPASYKGCDKYRQYKEKILKTKPTTHQAKPSTHTNLNPTTKVPYNTTNSTNTKPLNRTKSFADALKGKPNNPVAHQTHDPMMESGHLNMTNLLDAMFNRFQEIMKNMMDSMMDRMIQLITRLAPQRD